MTGWVFLCLHGLNYLFISSNRSDDFLVMPCEYASTISRTFSSKLGHVSGMGKKESFLVQSFPNLDHLLESL